MKEKALTLLLLCFCLIRTSVSAAEMETGLALKQNSSVIGATTILITKGHAKLSTPARNLTFLVDPNRIVIFSRETKLFYETSIEAYPGPPMAKLMMLSGLSSKDFVLVKSKDGSLMGQTTCDYAINKIKKKGSEDIFAHKFKQLLMFTNTGVNPRLAQAICKIYGLPPLTDLPAELDYEQFGPIVKGISTYSFQKQNIKNSEFAMPPGLKKVNSEAALSRDSLDELSRF